MDLIHRHTIITKNNKMKYLIISILFFVYLFSACEKENAEPIDMPSGLYAVWVENGYDEDVSIFEKSSKFDDNKYGFQLLPDGKFVERKNSGWVRHSLYFIR